VLCATLIKAEADCDRFRKNLESGRPVLATKPALCGIPGVKLTSFKRDERIHDKHSRITIYEFGKSPGGPG
jgi:hypothetical protein